jgi:hypothetical protein
MTIIIRMPDIRRALMCGRGVQGWFKLRGLDYDRFIREGFPIEELAAVDCEMSRQVCNSARQHYSKEI